MIAIYGDVHLTKKMGALQSVWDENAIQVFKYMYGAFNDKHILGDTADTYIDCAVCLGDFFDAPRLEARSVKLVTEILSIMNNSSIKTYILLGNHEIFDEESNILEILSEYENIIPVVDSMTVGNLTFIPYNVDPETVEFSGNYVFTHHDIYGSELAGGKVKSSFGISPDVFQSAKRVFNGHVHLRSQFGNILNVGSLLKSQQGELHYLEAPAYYLLDTREDAIYERLLPGHYLAYQTVNIHQIPELLSSYPENVSLVLRLDYDESEEIADLSVYESNPRILRMSIRKTIKGSLHSDEFVKKSALDLKEIITNYIRKDSSLTEDVRARLIPLSMSLLEVKK